MKHSHFWIMAMVFVVAGWKNATCAGDEIAGEIRLLAESYVLGEVVPFDVFVRNQSNESKELAKLSDGYRSGRVRAELIGPDGVSVRSNPRPELSPQQASDWQTLTPGSTAFWSSAQTKYLSFSPKQAGQHVLRIVVPFNTGSSITIEKRFEAVSPPSKDILAQVHIPLKGADWAERTEEGIVEAVRLNDQYWLFYRRRTFHGDVLVQRVARMGDVAKFIAAGDADAIEIAWINQLGHVSTTRVKSQDGVPFEAPK